LDASGTHPLGFHDSEHLSQIFLNTGANQQVIKIFPLSGFLTGHAEPFLDGRWGIRASFFQPFLQQGEGGPGKTAGLPPTQAPADLSVEKAMALLPEEQRTAIVLKEYHGLTFQEIAELVGCPLSTVKTRLYQGLVVLRRELAKNSKATL